MNTRVNQYSNLVDALNYLSEEGFTKSFVCKDEGLVCAETREVVNPADLSIVSYHRFEGNKDLGDVSVIYAVQREDGLKGVVIDGYSTYADDRLSECIRQFKSDADKTVVDR
jgi:hypothetical protein